MSTSPETGRREGTRITVIGAVANGFLIILKFLGGIVGNSHALVADAVHSLSDFFTDLVVLVGLWAGRRGPDEGHHFGHARIETMASALVGLSLVGVGALLGYDAGVDVYQHTENHPTWLALAGAIASIVTKEVLYQYTVHVGRKIKSPVVVANAWHHRSDALSSVAVALGLLATQINPHWHILDSYAALLVSFMVAAVGIRILWGAIKEVIDTAPSAEVLARIEACITRTPGVMRHHGLKVRSSGGILQIQVHVVVDGGLPVTEGHHIADYVSVSLRKEFEDLGEVIVHVDPHQPPEDCRPD